MLIDIANQQISQNNVMVVVINKNYQNLLLKKFDSRIKIVLLNRHEGSRSLLPIVKLNLLPYNFHADIIHFHNGDSPQLLLPQIGRKVFMTIHCMNFPLQNAKRMNRLIAISKAVKDDVVSHGVDNVSIVYNGIHSYQILHKTNDIIRDTKPVIIVQVANITPHTKGQDILIKAISILKKQGYNNFEAHFIGKGDAITELEEMATKDGVNDQIVFHGSKDRQWIYSNLKEFDIMCHPARFEGFGLSVVEGMTAGIPVLVPNEGGPYEVIAKGKYGYTFEMENANDCAGKLLYIASHYRQARELAVKARQFAIDNYSITKTVELYENIYKEF